MDGRCFFSKDTHYMLLTALALLNPSTYNQVIVSKASIGSCTTSSIT
jgi:hypothetical protein